MSALLPTRLRMIANSLRADIDAKTLLQAADEIERLTAEARTLRNLGISQMEQINQLLANQRT